MFFIIKPVNGHSLYSFLQSCTFPCVSHAASQKAKIDHSALFLDPGEAAATSSEVKRLWKDLRCHRFGRDVSPQLF